MRKNQAIVILAAFIMAAAEVPCRAQAPVGIEALAGKPFGVGRIELQVPESLLPEPLGPSGLGVSAAGGRVLYPAIDAPMIGQVVKGILDQSQRPLARIIGGFINNVPPKATIYFLFTGDAPLELTLQGRTAATYRVVPLADPTAYSRLFAGWWRTYTAPRGLLHNQVDYPPLVENYLQAMLARRLGLPLHAAPPSGLWPSTLEFQLGTSFDPEAALSRMRLDRMLGRAALSQKATLPLPPAPAAAEPPTGDLPADVPVEPLALRVPAECLYARFGSFTNFLWFQDTLARWGGDLRNLLAKRGLNYHQTAHMERQLALHQTALSRLLGETVVADAAIVGTDMDLIDGAAIGILFYARNNLLLGTDMARQRQDALKANAGATEKKLTIDGHSVSFLASPDGTIRSFYVADGSYHFVTSSESLLRRFLATRSGEDSLGKSPEFRYARRQMPLARNDTVFVYLSAAFFRNLASPVYRIETQRRLQATADIELVQLARLASATEGKPGATIQELIEGGFLPPEFGPRPDGSQTILAGERIYDSLRGERGAMVPVADVPVPQITAAEDESYRQFAAEYTTKLGAIEPIMVAMKRNLNGDRSREHVVLDVQMSPLDRQHYAFFQSRLGQADRRQFVPLPGDMIAGEAITDRQRLFGALRDFGPSPERMAAAGRLLGPEGLLPIGRLRDLLVGYLGYTEGDGGLLEILNQRVVAPPDAMGIAPSARDFFWRLQSDRCTAFSFQYDVLAQVAPQLRFREALRPAQIRLFVGDLSLARLAPLANRLASERSRQTSLGNLRLLHAMTQQLHVPPEDAKDAAELLLGATLIDPLGGQYAYRPASGSAGQWTAPTLETAGAAGGILGGTTPEGYLAPPLNWFRGLDLDALLQENRLAAHAEIDMQLPAPKK